MPKTENEWLHGKDKADVCMWEQRTKDKATDHLYAIWYAQCHDYCVLLSPVNKTIVLGWDYCPYCGKRMFVESLLDGCYGQIPPMEASDDT